jgi:hypothetical protein
MKKLFLATMITLSMVMVSCSGGNTEESTGSTDSTTVDSIIMGPSIMDSTIINSDSTSVDTVK